MGSRNLAEAVRVRRLRRLLGRMPTRWLEESAELQSSLPNASDFMEKAKAVGLANLVSLRPETERQTLLELAQQVYFVLAGLSRTRKRVSFAWVRVAYEIRPQRHRPTVRTRNPFPRFTDALEAIETRRLHRCAVCNQFFYAIREEARCCSPKCSHTRLCGRFTLTRSKIRPCEPVST